MTCEVEQRGGGGGGSGGSGCRGGVVLTLQFEDRFRLVVDPSVHSAVSVLLHCLLRSYSFSYMEKKSLERQRNRPRPPSHQADTVLNEHTPHRGSLPLM